MSDGLRPTKPEELPMPRLRPTLRKQQSIEGTKTSQDDERTQDAGAGAAVTATAAIALEADPANEATDTEAVAGDSEAGEPSRTRDELTANEQRMADEIASRIDRSIPERSDPETVTGSGGSEETGTLDVFDRYARDGPGASGTGSHSRGAPEFVSPAEAATNFGPGLFDPSSTRHAGAAGLETGSLHDVTPDRLPSQPGRQMPDQSDISTVFRPNFDRDEARIVYKPGESPGERLGEAYANAGREGAEAERAAAEAGRAQVAADDAKAKAEAARAAAEQAEAEAEQAQAEADEALAAAKAEKAEANAASDEAGEVLDEVLEDPGPDGSDAVDPARAQAWMEYLAAHGHVRPGGDRGGEIDPNEHDTDAGGGGNRVDQSDLYGGRTDGGPVGALPGGGIVAGNVKGNIDWGPDHVNVQGSGPEDEIGDLPTPGSTTVNNPYGNDDDSREPSLSYEEDTGRLAPASTSRYDADDDDGRKDLDAD